MVSDNVNRGGGTFKVMPPRAKSFVDGEELLIVSIVVQLRCSKRPEEESDQADLLIRTLDGEDSRHGVI